MFHTRSLRGVFSCDTSPDDSTFKTINTLQVYMGSENVWLVAVAEGTATIADFVDKFIVGDLKVDPSLIVVKPVGPDLLDIQANLLAHGLRWQADSNGDQLTMSDTSPTTKMVTGKKISFFKVVFYPLPNDAAPVKRIGWPILGCVEAAKAALSTPLSNVLISTGQLAPRVKEAKTKSLWTLYLLAGGALAVVGGILAWKLRGSLSRHL